jgi:TetR/AcrR family transcriptional regulator
MKRIRNGERTRSGVITAAENLFSSHGFNGTSIRMLAEASGFSEGLILHHFRTKENLYRIVREAASAAYIQTLAKNFQVTEGMDIPEMIGVMAHSAFRYFSDHPSYIRLVWWAYLEGQEIFSDNERTLAVNTFKMIRTSQDRGGLKKNISPHVILSVLLGATHYWVSRGKILETIEPLKPAQKKKDDWFIKDLIKLIIEDGN